MNDLILGELKRKLESMRCEECNQHPVVTITRGVVTTSACCESFKAKLQAETKRLMPLEADKVVRKSIDDIFRKFKR